MDLEQLGLSEDTTLQTRRIAVSWRMWVLGLGAALGVSLLMGLLWNRYTARRTEIHSLAVLPFATGGDTDSEYLCDGIAHNLINSLSQVPNLAVMSRNSTFRYKDKNLDAQTAGRELKVEAVLTGRILRRNDSLLISVELLDVRRNNHLWGERYNCKLADILDGLSVSRFASRFCSALLNRKRNLPEISREISS